MLRALPSVVAILALVAPAAAQGTAPSAPARLSVSLELRQEFFYEGDSLIARLSITNVGDAEVANPVGGSLWSGFVVRDADGKPLEKGARVTAVEPERPQRLAPGAFFGGSVDLVEMYPILRKAGVYQIHWSSEGLISDLVRVTVIPRFDPGKNYSAKVRTSRGEIDLELFVKDAPLAVKAFVDLARSGYYTGLLFQEVHADSHVVAGDARFGATHRPAVRYPAEPSSLRPVAGSLVAKPVGAAPPANGAEFMILLRPQPGWSGQVTVFGRVVRGLEIAQGISRLPVASTGSEFPLKPVEDARILDVSVLEATAVEPVADPSAAPGS